MSKLFLEDVAIPLARQWMQECLETHVSCAKMARHSSIFCTDNMHLITDIGDGGLMPSRLLAIGPRSDGSSNRGDMIYLVESESLCIDSQYIALSHRWGLEKPFTTTTSNLHQLTKTGVSLHDLPQTFRDAIQVTRGLGYSYIWIDSLCIVQDDEEDWKSEARRMAIIFDKAVCTIAAMDGLDSSSGLVIANPSPNEVAILDSRAWVCQEYMISPRSLLFTNETIIWECRECGASEERPKMQKRTTGADPEGMPSHPKDIFVFFRDWRPLQGNLASNSLEKGDHLDGSFRVNDGNTEMDEQLEDQDIHTLREKTHDSTIDNTTSPIYLADGETLPGHAPHLTIQDGAGQDQELVSLYPDEVGSEPLDNHLQIVTELSHPKDTYYSFLKAWWQFLSLYTPRLLTYDSDKFLAINGITSVTQRWTHMRNTFGLWYHFLEYDICWYVDPDGCPATRPDKWLGPSWSWVSTRNGCVRNDIYAKLPVHGQLQLKPEIRTPVGTSFDMPLPFAAWKGYQYHSIDLKGSLREITITTAHNSNGGILHTLALDSVGRLSDSEVHEFRPDSAHEFPVGSVVEAYCLHVWHYDVEYLHLPEYIDIYLVVQQVAANGKNMGLHLQTEDVAEVDVIAERRMKRLGYIETRYGPGTRRPVDEIIQDKWWWWIQLV